MPCGILRSASWLSIPLVVACGNGAGVADAGPTDAASDASYPAFASSGMPQVVNNGGATLTTPTIVTVTWSADPNVATYEALADAIGASAYWSATTSEYGIGVATSGAVNHVHITTAPPATMADTDLATFIANQVGAAPASGWPVNDPQTVYVVYVPEATELTSGGLNACGSEDGYHDETSTSSIAHIVYAVIVEKCHDMQNVIDFSTETASHEIVESTTNPHVETDQAWAGFDPDHWAWELWQTNEDELADACEYFPDANYSEPALSGDWLQRTWSNAMAAAGHNPCVPAAPSAYYNATPLAVETVTVSTGVITIHTKGYAIPVGTTRTIQLGLYSDAPTPPWSIAVVEGDGLSTPATSYLTVTPETTIGANGDVINVDITTGGANANGVLVTAISTATGQPTHYMPFLVATQ